MRRSITGKIATWNGTTAHQYRRPRMPRRNESGTLHDLGPAAGDGTGPPLDPRIAGQLHLRVEPEQVGLDRVDSPEVEGLAHEDLVGMPPTPPQSDAADELVDRPPDDPERFEAVPPAFTADPAHHTLHVLGAGVDDGGSGVLVHGSSRPLRVPGRRPRRSLTRGETRPPSGDVEIGDRRDGGLDRRGHAERLMIGQRGGAGVGDDDVVLQTVDQAVGQRLRQRGHHVHPVRREPRCEKWHRHHQPTAQPGDVGVGVHQVAVRHHVGRPDFDHLVTTAAFGAAARSAVDRRNEVREQVDDRDRLNSRLGDPARCDHHR